MSLNSIEISYLDVRISDCLCALIVPAQAVDEPGYIKGVSGTGSSNKHEFHALAQTAYYQFQDDELTVERISEQIVITSGETLEVLNAGLVIYRDAGGKIQVVVHQDMNLRRLLEAANRFCTRWIRLDI